MTIHKSLIDSFAKSTARGAYGASLFIGKNESFKACNSSRKDLAS